MLLCLRRSQRDEGGEGGNEKSVPQQLGEAIATAHIFGCKRRQRTAYGAHAHRRGPCRVGPSIFNAEQKNLCGTGIEANTASMISSSGGVAVKAREQREKRRF